MKFIKSNFSKKIIIILILLMILSMTILKPVNAAWNFSGILMKPTTSYILSFLVSIDVQLGAFLTVVDIAVTGIGPIVEQITDAAQDETLTGTEDVVGVADTVIQDLFVGPDTIFTGGIALLNANIFEPRVGIDLVHEDSYDPEFGDGGIADVGEGVAEEFVDGVGESIDNIASGVSNGLNFAGTIKRGIATTYVILRNICATIMLAGLIFTGIRVLVTSNTPNKMAQWRQLIADWLIGMILLIFSHVIMYGIFWFSDKLTYALAKNLIGFGSLNFQLAKECLMAWDSATQIVTLVLLGYLIYLTIVYAIAYFKRLLWICVLIVIAPVVSIMYAFGNQTKQIYSSWIREYITTVLIQPFHLIVYYTLVAVPLNMVSGGTFEYDPDTLSLFKMIYALGAISFIRPAEKYIRELFKMHQGVAALASYESGKQTLNQVIDVSKKVAKTAMDAGRAAAGDPTAMQDLFQDAKGLKDGAKGIGDTMIETPDKTPKNVEEGKLGAAAGELMEEGQEMAEDGAKKLLTVGAIAATVATGGAAAPVAGEMIAGEAMAGGAMAEGAMAEGAMAEGAMAEGAMTEGAMTEGAMTEGTDSVLQKYNSEGFGKNANGEYFNPWTDEYDPDYDPHNDTAYNPDYGKAEEPKDRFSLGRDALDDEDYYSGDENYDNNLQNSGSQRNFMNEEQLQDLLNEYDDEEERAEVERQLREEGHGNIEDSSDSSDNSENNSDNVESASHAGESSNANGGSKNIDTSNIVINANNVNLQGNVKADSASDKSNVDSTEDAKEALEENKEEGNEEENKGGENIDTTPEIIDEGEGEHDGFLARRKKELWSATNLATGNTGLFGALENLSPDSMFGSRVSQFLESDMGKKLKAFEELGGLKDLHEGFNTIRDGFFVGQAPGDWKETNKRMDESYKANIEQIKFNICNNEKYIMQVMQKEGYVDKLRKQYTDKNRYSDARIYEMAKDKAKEKIKTMSDTYVPHGIKDPVRMLQLDDDRKKYGLTVEQAITQRYKYEQFNSNSENIKYINQTHPGTNARSVEDAIPSARDHYNNGYRNVGDITRVNELIERLGVTADMGRKLDRALSNKGSKINLKLDQRKDLNDKQKEDIRTFIDKNYKNNGAI